jgi:ketosteroid isomerase-like protein
MIRLRRAFLGLLALAAARAPAAAADESGDSALRQLNGEYVRAYLASDVDRFRSLLADDFSGVLANGLVVGKTAFLQMAALKPDALDLRLQDLTIRVYGDTGLVGAAVAYHKADGTPVRTRYATVYIRRQGRWEIVWVQWTRITAP